MSDTSEDRRIDRELRLPGRSTDPFASAVRATRMPMLITDPRQPDNPIIFVNDAFARLTGYSRDETLGRNCRFLQGPGTNIDDVRRLREAIEATRTIEIDLLNYRKNGTTFWNRVLVSPVFDSEGGLSFFFASQFDVTPERDRLALLEADRATLERDIERRIADLSQSENRLRFTLAAARLGAWTVDLRTGRLVASARCKAMFGRGPSESLSYEDLQAAIHAEDIGRWGEAVEAAMAGTGEFGVECRVASADGSHAWIEMRGQVSFAAGGAPLSMAGVSLDVTERRRTALDLQELEERRSMALAVGDVGTFDIDLKTGEVGWDDLTRSFYGIPPGQTVTIELAMEAVHPEDRSAVRRKLGEIAAGLHPTFDLEYRVLDHVTRHLYVRGRTVFAADASAARIVGAVRDVSDRVADEARRRMHNAELGHRLKNTFAVVQALVAQTLRGAPDVETARDLLSRRIEALSHAHDALLGGQAEGAAVADLVRSATLGHDPEGRIEIRGPEVWLRAQDAMSLSLVLHELATNATKYGALSVPEGRVSVTWTPQAGEEGSEPAARIVWKETSGPAVAPPSRRGFGSRVLRAGLSGGEAAVSFEPDGVRCVMVAHLGPAR